MDKETLELIKTTNRRLDIQESKKTQEELEAKEKKSRREREFIKLKNKRAFELNNKLPLCLELVISHWKPFLYELKEDFQERKLLRIVNSYVGKFALPGTSPEYYNRAFRDPKNSLSLENPIVVNWDKITFFIHPFCRINDSLYGWPGVSGSSGYSLTLTEKGFKADSMDLLQFMVESPREGFLEHRMLSVEMARPFLKRLDLFQTKSIQEDESNIEYIERISNHRKHFATYEIKELNLGWDIDSWIKGESFPIYFNTNHFWSINDTLKLSLNQIDKQISDNVELLRDNYNYALRAMSKRI